MYPKGADEGSVLILAWDPSQDPGSVLEVLVTLVLMWPPLWTRKWDLSIRHNLLSSERKRDLFLLSYKCLIPEEPWMVTTKVLSHE